MGVKNVSAVLATIAIMAFVGLASTPAGGNTSPCEEDVEELLALLPDDVDKHGDVFVNYEIILDWIQNSVTTQEQDQDTAQASSNVAESCTLTEDEEDDQDSEGTYEEVLACNFPVGFGVPLKCTQSYSQIEVQFETHCTNGPDPDTNCWTYTSEGSCLSLYDEGTCRLQSRIFDQLQRDVSEPYAPLNPTHIPPEQREESNATSETCHRVRVTAIGADHSMTPTPATACIPVD